MGRGNITLQFAVFAGGHVGFGFENTGKIMLIGKSKMVGYGLDRVPGVLQKHFSKADFAVQKIGVGRCIVVLLEFPDHFRSGNEQLIANVINGNRGIYGFVQFCKDLLCNGGTLWLVLGLFSKLHKNIEQEFTGFLVNLVVVYGNLFQRNDLTHFLEYVSIVEYIGLLQVVFIKYCEEHITFEIDPDFLKRIILVSVVFVRRTWFQKVNIICLKGVNLLVYNQIALSRHDVFQNEVCSVRSADAEVWIRVGDSEAFNRQRDVLGTVVDVGQYLIFQSGKTGNVLLLYMVKRCVFFHNAILPLIF